MDGRIARTRRTALVLLACASLGACSGGNAGGAGGSGIKLAMVTDVGGLGDKSFNDSAYRGLQEAKTAFGAQITVLESKSAADYQPNLTALANAGNDEIFAVGYLMNQDLDQVALNYPQSHFAIIDTVVDEPNVVSVTFREQESSFLAGALAAMMTKTKTIAFLGGVDVPLIRKFEAGFTAGAREIDPSVHVLVKYVGSFEDVASGRELAALLFDDKADVVFIGAGKSGLGAIDELRARSGVYGIGVDSDQDGLAPGKILTSVVKNVDTAVFKIAAQVHDGHPPVGHIELGLKEGGVGLTNFAYTKSLIGAAKIARLARLRQAIIEHEIVPPTTREALATFKPVAL
ncbi:MAG TPA: BMP family ABC transporter substrate-binding protein [Candidatus Acidoferrales bacterium]|nr:BMP family ABC transporter substrate-binding protein [Candidatus Acidoferrales bacterium]